MINEKRWQVEGADVEVVHGAVAYPSRIDEMLFLPSAWTYEARLPSEARIPELWDSVVPVISGTGADIVCSSLPQHGPGYGSRLRTRLSRTQGSVYAVIPQTESIDQSTLQGMFLFSRL